MISSALFHFPHIRFKDSTKYLWNPVLKKTYKQRPEERVRLQLVEYLMEEVEFPKTRISFESPVSMPGDKSSSRTDLIGYDSQFKPLLLVECKAPEIQLDEKAALQITRYNTKVHAPFLLVTNGMRDFWFSIEQDQVVNLETIPDLFAPKKASSPTFSYWAERGFAGSLAQPEVQQWVTENATLLYKKSSNPARFFSFEGTEPDLFLANYYQVLLMDAQTRLAVALSATPFGSTKLTAILNEGGQNTGLLSASLDIIASDQTENTMIQNATGLRMVDLVEEIGFDFQHSIKVLAASITYLLK